MKFNIDGYESMTPEEKISALEAYDPEKNGFVKKETFDKAASDAANYKKQLREKMSEDEARSAKDAEDRAALEARVKELEAERAVNTYVTSYLAMGYDEKLARSSAEALVKGDMDTVFKNQQIYSGNREKALRAELLKQTPRPAAGGGTGKMDYQSKIQAAQAAGDVEAVAYYTRLSQEVARTNE